MKHIIKKDKDRGFVLSFTLLFVGVMLLIVVVTANSTIQTLQSSRQTVKSLKAYYAADAGVRCVEFYNTYHGGVFDSPTSGPGSGIDYDCGDPSFDIGTFEGGPRNAVITDCTAPEREFTLTFPNGSCANVTVKANKDPFNATTTLCDLSIVSSGRSSCTATANVVERTRYLNIQ